MSEKTILEATTKHGYTLWISEFDAGGKTKVMLDCSRDYRGSKAFEELPRVYSTPRGAKTQAAHITGESLTWSTPCD